MFTAGTKALCMQMSTGLASSFFPPRKVRQRGGGGAIRQRSKSLRRRKATVTRRNIFGIRACFAATEKKRKEKSGRLNVSSIFAGQTSARCETAGGENCKKGWSRNGCEENMEQTVAVEVGEDQQSDTIQPCDTTSNTLPFRRSNSRVIFLETKDPLCSLWSSHDVKAAHDRC